MLNYGIIEQEAYVTILMCLVAAAAMLATSDQSHQLRELLQKLLPEILTKGLTTMLLPCTICTRQDYYTSATLYGQLALRRNEC